jgi:N-hydroxyarylamine O-acetyltransferase
MDHATAGEYLRRIEAAPPAKLDAAALARLHHAHLLSVPFENLSIHLGEPISLAEDDLVDKIITRRRGGFCYELNGAFALLLRALGATVGHLAARVYSDGQLSPPFDHLALAVRLPDGSGPWLADVGFGDHSVYPLSLADRTAQRDPGGEFLLADAEDGDVDVYRDGRPQYRLEMRERSLPDFVPTCWWQQTSPRSHFTQSTICSRLTRNGRISLSGHRLIITTGASRTERDLADEDEVLAAYREHFGISLSRLPRAAGLWPVPATAATAATDLSTSPGVL